MSRCSSRRILEAPVRNSIGNQQTRKKDYEGKLSQGLQHSTALQQVDRQTSKHGGLPRVPVAGLARQ